MGGAPLLHRQRVREPWGSLIHCPQVTGVLRRAGASARFIFRHARLNQVYRCNANVFGRSRNVFLYLLNIVRHLDKVDI